MKVSVIVTVFNNASTIIDAIDSILLQDYSNIECIVIDAGSTDGTIEALNQNISKIDVFVSEADKGIYDGLNKGVAMATGDVIAFLHSDDVYADTKVVSDVVSQFQPKIQGVYGDLVYTEIDNFNKVIRYWRSKPFASTLLNDGWMPPHPTLFLRRSVYEKYGSFDTSYSISGDYEFMLRILKEGVVVSYVPRVLYKMRIGGKSNRGIVNLFNKSVEDLRAMRYHGLRNPFYGLLYKNISKLIQLIRR
jgi:glycosyltransferase